MATRVLIAARHPIRVEDFGLAGRDDIEVVRLVRRLRALEEVVGRERADVVIVDVTFPEGRAFDAIADLKAHLPDVTALALVPSAPDHADVSRAVGAGATGFVDVDAEPEEFADAIETVDGGGVWFPDDTTLSTLRDVSGDLEITAGERRSRLLAVVVGLIPLAGVLAAIWSLLWRKYLGHIGVRPVDLAIDPASRTIDAFLTLFFFLGFFGPLLYVHTWTDQIIDAAVDRPATRWLVRFRWLIATTLIVGVVVLGVGLAQVADLVLAMFVGPVVAVSILAEILHLSDSLPSWLRITLRSGRRAATIGLTMAFVFFAFLSTEVLVYGPTFSGTGVEGVVVPRVLGFRAQPALVTDVNDGSQRERLYLGGNADLYVLVDPCDDDAVEMVSVGSSRIDIIDEVTC